MYSLKFTDFIKGAIMAVFTAVILMLFPLVTAEDFSIFNVDWIMLLDKSLSLSFATFLAYIVKNFFTDDSGRFAGKV